jgi:serine/threonine protein kinase
MINMYNIIFKILVYGEIEMKCGELFQGKYKIHKILGSGGMGKVYLAENINLGTFWAIKEVHKQEVSELDFLAEANILKKLSHPALPRIFDVVEEEDRIFVIFDYIEGTPLDKKLEREGRFSEQTVINWAKEICEVLIYLHSIKPNPIIYRDMKPSNIILAKDGSIKLIDFGIAREYKSNVEKDTVYIGTRGYAAPEQYGRGQTNPRTDIYNLGMTLHYLITGKNPAEPSYEYKPVRFYDSTLSKEIEYIIEKCTKIRPEDRYSNVNELLDHLKKISKNSNYSIHNNEIRNIQLSEQIISTTSNFRKLVLTVWDNPEFGCEFAYIAAKLTSYNVMLIDLDLLSPKADLYLNIKKFSETIISEGLVSDSSISIAMDFIEKNSLDINLIKELSVKRKELKNLYVLTGNYKLENYEYYNDHSLEKLIEKCYQYFDITVLLVNRSIYDSYTVISMLKSDYNLVPIRADLDNLRDINSQLVFLKDKQHIYLEKTKIIAFEYNSSVNLGESTLEELSQNNYFGSIRFSSRRTKYRNLKLCYARRMEKEVLADYKKILSKFSIVPKTTMLEKLKNSTNRLLIRKGGN